jgi:hypothetical protein
MPRGDGNKGGGGSESGGTMSQAELMVVKLGFDVGIIGADAPVQGPDNSKYRLLWMEGYDAGRAERRRRMMKGH